MFVLLKGPTYYRICMACSKKHFELLDSGYSEIDTGCYMKLWEKKSYLEWYDFTDGGKKTAITVKRIGQYAYSLYNEETLEAAVNSDPDFFSKYQIVEDHNWFLQ